MGWVLTVREWLQCSKFCTLREQRASPLLSIKAFSSWCFWPCSVLVAENWWHEVWGAWGAAWPRAYQTYVPHCVTVCDDDNFAKFTPW